MAATVRGMDDHRISLPVASAYHPDDLRVTCSCGWRSVPCGAAADAAAFAQAHLDGRAQHGPTLDVGDN